MMRAALSGSVPLVPGLDMAVAQKAATTAPGVSFAELLESLPGQKGQSAPNLPNGALPPQRGLKKMPSNQGSTARNAPAGKPTVHGTTKADPDIAEPTQLQIPAQPPIPPPMAVTPAVQTPVSTAPNVDTGQPTPTISGPNKNGTEISCENLEGLTISSAGVIGAATEQAPMGPIALAAPLIKQAAGRAGTENKPETGSTDPNVTEAPTGMTPASPTAMIPNLAGETITNAPPPIKQTAGRITTENKRDADIADANATQITDGMSSASPTPTLPNPPAETIANVVTRAAATSTNPVVARAAGTEALTANAASEYTTSTPGAPTNSVSTPTAIQSPIATTPVYPAAAMADANRAVALRISRAIRSGEETLNLELHPAELGRVSVRLAFHDTGIDVQMVVNNHETFQAFSQDRAGLEQQFTQAGIDLGAGGLDLRFGQNTGGEPSAASTSPSVAGDVSTEVETQTVNLGDGLLNIVA